MSENEEDLLYEQKLDRITEHIEELVLDAMLAALEKIKKRNLFFSSRTDNGVDDSEKVLKSAPGTLTEPSPVHSI